MLSYIYVTLLQQCPKKLIWITSKCSAKSVLYSSCILFWANISPLCQTSVLTNLSLVLSHIHSPSYATLPTETNTNHIKVKSLIFTIPNQCKSGPKKDLVYPYIPRCQQSQHQYSYPISKKVGPLDCDPSRYQPICSTAFCVVIMDLHKSEQSRCVLFVPYLTSPILEQ